MTLAAESTVAGGDDSRSGFLPDRILHLHPTRLCNLACRHCYSESDPQQQAALDALVLACLEKSPALRPQNAEELLARLHTCEAGNDWTGAMAQRWWKTHLPELAGPLPSIDVQPPSVADAETI